MFKLLQNNFLRKKFISKLKNPLVQVSFSLSNKSINIYLPDQKINKKLLTFICHKLNYEIFGFILGLNACSYIKYYNFGFALQHREDFFLVETKIVYIKSLESFCTKAIGHPFK